MITMKLSTAYKRKAKREDAKAKAKWKRILACRAKMVKSIRVEGSLKYSKDGYVELVLKDKRGLLVHGRHIPKTRSKPSEFEFKLCSPSGRDKIGFEMKG
jgi:hypothetical protein